MLNEVIRCAVMVTVRMQPAPTGIPAHGTALSGSASGEPEVK